MYISGSIEPFTLISVDDANFGQSWWRQKWNKGQGLSWAVTVSTGVNGLMKGQNIKKCQQKELNLMFKTDRKTRSYIYFFATQQNA